MDQQVKDVCLSSDFMYLIVVFLSQVESEHLGAARVDGHITLFYGDRKLADHVLQVVEDMQHFLATAPPKLHFKSLTSWDYAETWYAWCDIIVQCQLHHVLHRLVRSGVGDGRRHGVWLRQALNVCLNHLTCLPLSLIHI